MSHLRSLQGARQPSSQGPRIPASPPQQLSLEEMRQRMLFRRPVDLNRDDIAQPAEEAPTATRHVFGRLVMSNSPQHPSNTNDASDPHKLFQMLRRKKRNAAPPEKPVPPQPSTFVSYTRQSPDRSDPLPRMDCDSDNTVSPTTDPNALRPQAACRPMAADIAARHAMSAGGPGGANAKRLTTAREVHSATPAGNNPDGRPATRQKPLSQSLDLFESTNGKKDDDMFPKPVPRKIASRQRLTDAPRQGSGLSTAKPNFQCLFVSGDGDLDGGHEEFPSPKTQVDIPLIETDWFTTSSWEELPDPADQNGGADLGSSVSFTTEDDTSQSLYDLLVAQKNRKSRR